MCIHIVPEEVTGLNLTCGPSKTESYNYCTAEWEVSIECIAIYVGSLWYAFVVVVVLKIHQSYTTVQKVVISIPKL